MQRLPTSAVIACVMTGHFHFIGPAALLCMCVCVSVGVKGERERERKSIFLSSFHSRTQQEKSLF